MKHYDYQKDIEKYNHSIQEGNELDYYKRGLAYFAIREYEKALQDFTKILELNKQEVISEFFYYKRARCFQIIGRMNKNTEYHQKALESINKAIEINPYNTDYHKLRAAAYSQLSEDEKCLDSYYKTLELDLGNYHNNYIYFVIGKIYQKRKEYEKSIEIFNKRIESPYKESDDCNVYYFRALSFIELKDYKQAISDIEKSMEVFIKFKNEFKPDHIHYKIYENDCSNYLKKCEKLIQDLQKLIKENNH